MKLEHQVCSLDLAKRLKELGVKQYGYFSWYNYAPIFAKDDMGYETSQVDEVSIGEWVLRDEEYLYETDPINKRKLLKDGQKIAAFTVAELGEILPRSVKSEKGEDLFMWFEKCKPTVETGEVWHYARFGMNFVSGKTEADARAKMLIYLIEQGLVRP